LPVDEDAVKSGCRIDAFRLSGRQSRAVAPVIKASPELLDRILRGPSRLVHFVGVAGSGMSALAQYRAIGGGRTSGSDRSFDHGGAGAERAQLERLGVILRPQDGSGVAPADLVVTSTAVEDSIPDVVAAAARGIPVAHRAEVLAALVRSRPTIAVTGSSGKSTAVAMVFEALRGCGLDPGVITGGDLRVLQGAGLKGNAWIGRDWLVIEADESDKSLVHYEPEIGVILNVHRDHYEAEEVLQVFDQFRKKVRKQVVLGEDEALASLRDAQSVTFGPSPAATIRVESVVPCPNGVTFRLDGVLVALPIPGAHNAWNAAAALAACRAAGVPLHAAAAALARFRGVARRFEVVGSGAGVEVVDDFAHNPAKVAAALATARERSRRVLAFFQPHGYAPMRFMRAELVRAFAEGLRPNDQLFLPEIFYTGGTATRDLSSRDLCADVAGLGGRAEFLRDRRDLLRILKKAVAPGDCVLVMGARDPSLADFAREVAAVACERRRRFAAASAQ
jgi:UDP-N-acetylmuramate--alanine ligase